MKGDIEACSNAEAEIMSKLREAYENDIVAVNVSYPSLPFLFCWQGQRGGGGGAAM